MAVCVAVKARGNDVAAAVKHRKAWRAYGATSEKYQKENNQWKISIERRHGVAKSATKNGSSIKWRNGVMAKWRQRQWQAYGVISACRHGIKASSAENSMWRRQQWRKSKRHHGSMNNIHASYARCALRAGGGVIFVKQAKPKKTRKYQALM